MVRTSAFIGTWRVRPAFVCRMVRTLVVKSTSSQRRPKSSPRRRPVLSASATIGQWVSPVSARRRIFSAAGERQGTVLVIHDLTRLKQLERTREEFVANVSHELRTPLSLIGGYVETLLDGAKDNPEVSVKFLQTIQRNSERLQFLIEDLLTISQLESGRLTMHLQPVRLPALVDKVLEDFRSRAAARGTTLANAVPDWTAPADADQLQQVLGNL